MTYIEHFLRGVNRSLLRSSQLVLSALFVLSTCSAPPLSWGAASVRLLAAGRPAIDSSHLALATGCHHARDRPTTRDAQEGNLASCILRHVCPKIVFGPLSHNRFGDAGDASRFHIDNLAAFGWFYRLRPLQLALSTALSSLFSRTFKQSSHRRRANGRGNVLPARERPREGGEGAVRPLLTGGAEQAWGGETLSITIHLQGNEPTQ